MLRLSRLHRHALRAATASSSRAARFHSLCLASSSSLQPRRVGSHLRLQRRSYINEDDMYLSDAQRRQLTIEKYRRRKREIQNAASANAESISRELNEVDSELVVLAKSVLADEKSKPGDKDRARGRLKRAKEQDGPAILLSAKDWARGCLKRAKERAESRKQKIEETNARGHDWLLNNSDANNGRAYSLPPVDTSGGKYRP